jgi:uncharacterized protein (TIGR02391 family)
LVKKPSEQLSELLEQAEDLERRIGALQTKPGTDSYRTKSVPVDEQEIWALREEYFGWHAKAMTLLPADLKTQFDRNFQGSGPNIKTFLENPTKRYHRQGGSTRMTMSSGYTWSHPMAKYFTEPFTAQRMILQRARQRRLVQASMPARPASQSAEPDPIALLHPEVGIVAQKLFQDGHFRQAVFDAWLELNKAVQEKSGRPDLDGTALMQEVFSPRDPVLKFEGHPDEQLGYMWLFSGGVMAIRNPCGHTRADNAEDHRQETLELLAMISALFRALDRAHQASELKS